MARPTQIMENDAMLYDHSEDRIVESNKIK